ncbi:MAG: hypothetical protein ACJ74U_15340 [Jatrophihabitantaceae bacterium]
MGRHRLAGDGGRRPRRWLAIAGVASLLAVLIPLAAKGDTPPVGSNGSVGLVRNDVWIGFYQIPGLDGPLVCGHNGDGSWYPDGPYSSGQVVATFGDGAAVAWLLDQYASTTDPNTAAAIDAVNSRYGSNTGGLDDYNIAVASGLGSAISGLLADGRDFAGPYTVSITGLVTAATGEFDTTYTAAVHVRSAAGNAVAGQLVSLAGHGAHLFASAVRTNRGGDATFQYSVPSSVPSPNFTIDATTSVPVLIRYTYLGPSAPHMPQDVVGSGTRPVKVTAAGAVDPYLSAISFIKYTTGDAGKTPVAGAVFSVTDVTQGRLLGSITSQTVPVSLAGADIMAGDTLRFVETKAPPGHYSQGPVTVTIPANAQDNYQVQIPNPLTPTLQLSTQVPAALAGISTVLGDQVTISGEDGEDGTDTATLLGPIQPDIDATDCAAVTAEQWAAAPAVATYTLPVDGGSNAGNGSHIVTGTSIGDAGTGPGCYGWRHHLVLVPSGATADSGPTDPGETSLVLAPSASTFLNTYTGPVGSYLTDTLVLAGTHGRPVQVAGQLVRKPAIQFGRSMTCDPLLGAWTDATPVTPIRPFTVTGDGQHPVPGRYLATSNDCYSFNYQLQVILDPNSTDPTAAAIPLTLAAGDQAETAQISAPTISTAVSATTTSPATTITDQIRLSGLHLPPGDTAVLRAYYLGTEPVLPTPGSNLGEPACPNNAVLDQLPAEGRPSTAGCNPTGWEHTPIAATPAPITISGDGTYTTDPITLPAQAGYGSWVETLTYNGLTVALTPPGIPAETVHAAAPTISTTAVSTDPAAGNAVASDTLAVTGLTLQPGDTASISAHVLSSVSDGSSCDGIDWAVADHNGPPTGLQVPGDGNYTTSPVSLGLGCHTYYEILTINGHPVVTDAEQSGQPAETILITAPATPTPTTTPTPTPTPSSSTPAPSPTPISSGTPTAPATATPATPPAPSRPPTVEGGGHSLASTGTDTGMLLALALAAVGLGGLALLVSRRRGADGVSR